MGKTKISKIARDLNVAISTLIDYLNKKGITISNNPNTRVEDDVVDMLVSAFQKDKELKSRADQIASQRQREREAEAERKAAEKASQQKASEPAPKPGTNEIHLGSKQKPTFLGKIELDAKGNPIPKPAPKPAEPAAQKPAEKPAAPAKPQVEATAAPKVSASAPAAEKKVEAAAKPVQEVKVAVEAKAPAAEKKVEAAAKPVQEPKAAVEAKAPVHTEAKAPVQPEQKPKAQQEQKPQQVREQHQEPKRQDNSNLQPKAEERKEAPKAEHKPEHKGSSSHTAPENKAASSKKAVVEDNDDYQAPAASSSKDDDDEIFTIPVVPVGPQINVVGKIDLDSINQSMRPKKKSANERKKRKRIGKEKIDIEKTSQENEAGNKKDHNKGGNKDQNRHDKKKDKNNDRQKRPVHVVVNEEDVQKQVKETLARLTNKDKGQKKGVKWRKEKRDAAANREREAAEVEMAESKVLKLTEFVTANDLAIMMDVPINKVIATCMNIGVMVSINQRLDAETINIVAEEFGFETEYVSAEVAEAIQQDADSDEDLVPRPPIVTVMGHVDHGKTSLLDYIRNANVIAGEAGGITQHIGAYNVKLEDGRHITFLDTPGHEAFTAMRARGAKVTDLCIIIVAADDNVMPQTVEAINHASAAGVPMVFAINKIDKPHANPEKIKEELANMNYLVEDWGGKYQSQDISAKKGIGVNELMEKVLLEAEMLELKANPNRNATGSVIESSLDKGRGYIATVLVQNGTLRTGDIVLAGTHYGKIRAMFNERNQRVTEAGPSTPVLILGLNGAPTAGDTFTVMETEQEAREIASKREQLQREQGLRTTKMITLEDIGRRRAIGNFQELNIIVKGDVDGSIEALSDSLIKLSTEEIQVNVLHKAVGEISESDITLAAASDAIIIGFQVRPSMAARRAAEREGVDIRLYSVIYQAIEEVKSAMEGMLAPEVKEEIIGSAEVLETYHISRVGTIAGTKVREGKIKRAARVRLIRDGIVRYTGELASLKRFKDDAKEVLSGYECGMSIQNFNDIKVGDIIECFEEVEVNRSL